MRRCRHVAALAVACGLACLAPLSAARTTERAPPCAVDVVVEPERPYVGQQILYRARIFRREDVDRVEWVQPPAFPNLRAEWLPGRAEDTRVRRGGARYLVREDQRALFAAWPGRTTLPSFELRCDDTTLAVPGPTLDVRRPPDRGRPAEFAGVIGPLVVHAAVDRDEIALGQSVRVSVLARGDSNLWDLELPFMDLDSNEVEIFRARPETDLEAGERLYVRRYFRFDFVPREQGTLQIPAVRVPYYDAHAGRYATARTEPVEVSVGPRPPVDTALPSGSEPLADDETPRGGGRTLAAGIAGAVVLAAAFAGWRLVRARRAGRAEVEAALRDAERSRERRDPAAQAAALSTALSRAVRHASPRRRERLEDETGAQLARLEEIRFARRAGDPPHEGVEALIRRLL